MADLLDSPLIYANYSRLLLDLNRDLQADDSIVAISEDIFIPGNQSLTESERQRRQQLYAPFHDNAERLITERLQTGNPLMVISMHSFTPVYHGEKRPWHIGVLSNTDRRLADALLSVLSAESDIIIGDGFTGELDQLEIANIARDAVFIKLAATSQGVDSKLLTIAAGAEGEAEEEGGGEANYLKILVDSLTLDAKIVIGILGVMFVISVWVMWSKAMLVFKTDKDNKKFLARFQMASTKELLVLDKGANYANSSLYKLYRAGLREIKKRQHPEQQLSLSGASMDAIKAAIDADLVRESLKQNAGMVLLTIAISGGPFLGLLGTVVGVMITFAAIAAAGDVNVNAIAPGIAAALLATVAGLAVAIPALFGYNYLASRIKNITIAMQIFVDEFVTRTAELYGKE